MEIGMITRLMPLAACLIWLACEANFSTAVFVGNVQFSLAEIKGGLDAILKSKYPQSWKVAGGARDAR
jgi:hypothetical protein